MSAEQPEEGSFEFGGDADTDDERLCWDGCGRVARAERYDRVVGRGDPNVEVELVCGRPLSCWLLGWVRWSEPAWWRT